MATAANVQQQAAFLEAAMRVAEDAALTTLVYPHQTGGGPSHPGKGPNTLTNMNTFWQNEYVFGSSVKSLVHLQLHKATKGIIQMSSIFGADPIKSMKETRERQGDMNLDRYRIIVACGPQYAALATSEDWSKIQTEYEAIHKLGQAFLAAYPNREKAGEEFVAWVIRHKINDLARRTRLSPSEKDRLVYELSHLRSIPPVQLANLERGYHQTWKDPRERRERVLKAEMMTWACSWEIEEVVRKFKDRRNGDQWGLPDVQISATLPKVSAPKAPKAPKRQTSESSDEEDIAPAPLSVTSIATSNDKVEDHAVYGIYFKMIKRGVPRAAVEQKMRNEGCDPALLDSPATVLTMSFGASTSTGTGEGLVTFLQSQQLRPAGERPAVERKPIATNPYESVLLSIMNSSQFRMRAEQLNPSDEDDDDDENEDD